MVISLKNKKTDFSTWLSVNSPSTSLTCVLLDHIQDMCMLLCLFHWSTEKLDISRLIYQVLKEMIVFLESALGFINYQILKGISQKWNLDCLEYPNHLLNCTIMEWIAGNHNESHIYRGNNRLWDCQQESRNITDKIREGMRGRLFIVKMVWKCLKFLFLKVCLESEDLLVS